MSVVDSIDVGGILAAGGLDSAVLDMLPIGVVVLDAAGRVVRYNRYEQELVRRRREDVLGRRFFEDVALCTNVPEIAGAFHDHIGSCTLDRDLEHQFPLPFLPRPRDVRLRMRSFRIEGVTYAAILIEDISVRKNLERERDSLLRMLVHDLKNPLGGIVGYASLLQESAAKGAFSADDAEAITMIEESGQRLSKLIQSTLDDLLRPKGREARREPVNLHALVLSTLAAQLPAARGRGLKVRYEGTELERAEFPHRAVAVRGIEDNLARIVDNLVTNAVKYAATLIDVRLGLEVSPQGKEIARLVVADDGRGVPEPLREKVFEEAYQIPGSKPGSGIGLYSALRHATDHGGTITCGERAGGGAAFTVTLPV